MQTVTLRSIGVFPVKSARGLSPGAWTLEATGLRHDRRFMVVDADGMFVTQRKDPKMAQIGVAIENDLLRIELPNGSVWTSETANRSKRNVTVWSDSLAADDLGDEVARLLSDFLGRPVRLVEFSPDAKRPVDATWTTSPVYTLFADGFPVLVVSAASVEALNARQVARGLEPVGVDRFRPNIVIDGVEAHDEDRIAQLVFDDETRLELVKPSKRCKVINTDQRSGEREEDGPMQSAAPYRTLANAQGGKGLMFGQNAIVVGRPKRIEVGMKLGIVWRESANVFPVA